MILFYGLISEWIELVRIVMVVVYFYKLGRLCFENIMYLFEQLGL